MSTTHNDATARQVSVCGPNLRDQRKGDFHVHAADCGDLKHYGRGRFGGETPWTIDAASRRDVVEAIYADMIDEDGGSWEDYAGGIWFAPCCTALPQEAAKHPLRVLHEYLFPERYADVETSYWNAGTIEAVAAMIERLASESGVTLKPAS